MLEFALPRFWENVMNGSENKNIISEIEAKEILSTTTPTPQFMIFITSFKISIFTFIIYFFSERDF